MEQPCPRERGYVLQITDSGSKVSSYSLKKNAGQRKQQENGGAKIQSEISRRLPERVSDFPWGVKPSNTHGQVRWNDGRGCVCKSSAGLAMQ